MRVYLSRYRLMLVLGLLGVMAGVVFWGRGGSVSEATAQPPAAKKAESQPAGLASTSDYSKRVVAYIFDTIPITREELGEYLIARMGAERVNNLVNRRIIEHICQQKGIEVTAAEVEADFTETLKGLNNITPKNFVDTLLKPYNKTLYEWKEDVIKPRLLLTKLCKDRVQVTEADLHEAYQAYYGEAVECRLIMWPKVEKNRVMNTIYAQIRDSDDEFERAATKQASHDLAAKGGRIEPIHRNTTGNEELEKAAFALRPGELSRVLDTPQGLAVLKCVKHIPAQTSVKLEGEVREKLAKEVYEKKLQREIPKFFGELHAQANPQVFLKTTLTEDELVRQAQQELHSGANKSGSAKGASLQGN
jgi:hypothetical protein